MARSVRYFNTGSDVFVEPPPLPILEDDSWWAGSMLCFARIAASISLSPVLFVSVPPESAEIEEPAIEALGVFGGIQKGYNDVRTIYQYTTDALPIAPSIEEGVSAGNIFAGRTVARLQYQFSPDELPTQVSLIVFEPLSLAGD